MCDAATADALKSLVLEEMLEGLDANKRALAARREIVLEIMGREKTSVCFDGGGGGYDLTRWKREKRKLAIWACMCLKNLTIIFRRTKPKGMIGWGGTKTLPGTSCDLLGVEKVKRKTKPKKMKIKIKII